MARMESEDFIGTCQWCFGEYKVNARGTVVLHGYTRPGRGYTVGNCPGYDKAPFEYEHSLTDERIAGIRVGIAENEKQLKLINDGKVTKIKNPGFVPEDSSKWKHPVRYGLNDSNRKTHLTAEDRNFDYYMRSFKASIENDIRFDTAIAEHLEAAVAAWTKKGITGLDSPATGKMRYLRGAYDPDKAKEAEEHAKRKAERAAKPGKITLTVYKVLPDYPPLQSNPPSQEEWNARVALMRAEDDVKKQFRNDLKQWTKDTFPADKYWVGDVYDGDITWRLRKDLQGKNLCAAATKIDWQYLDDVLAMFNEASPLVHRRDNSPKDIRIFVDIDEFPGDF